MGIANWLGDGKGSRQGVFDGEGLAMAAEFLVPLPLADEPEPELESSPNTADFLAKFQQPAKRNKIQPADEEQLLTKITDTLKDWLKDNKNLSGAYWGFFEVHYDSATEEKKPSTKPLSGKEMKVHCHLCGQNGKSAAVLSTSSGYGSLSWFTSRPLTPGSFLLEKRAK
jgi:nucleoid DNA-binding protein